MKYSDKPIVRPRQDIYGRSDTARHFAAAIRDIEIANDGFVIGVEANWGEGKTSFIELVLWYLEAFKLSDRSHQPLPGYSQPEPFTIQQLEEMEGLYVRVEPYMRSLEGDNRNVSMIGYESLLKKFQNWLESEIDGAKAAKYWRLTRCVASESPNIIVRFSPWLISGRAELATALLSELARAIKNELNGAAQAAIKDILARYSDFAPVVGAGADFLLPGSSSILNIFGGVSEKIADRMAKGPTLDELKSRLHNVLSKIEQQRILVIVDDLDRLTPVEALEVVGLVKSLCNLPNVIYILSYERQKLERLINAAAGVSDTNYLAKIVQYPFSMPPLNQDVTRSVFFNDIRVLLPDISDRDLRRINQAWNTILQYYLSNPRALKRYLNVLVFELSTLKNYVDAVDFVVLTALKVFELDIYNYIRSNILSIAR